MLSFSKGFNNQNNNTTNNYSKMGRISPEEIVQKRFENNMSNMNKLTNNNEAPNVNNTSNTNNTTNKNYISRFNTQPKEEVKPQVEQQRNNGAELFNKMSVFRHINNNK